MVLKEDEIISLARERAENLFSARGLCCSESVLYVLNDGFSGGLAPEMVIRLGAGLCHGMGGGCSCGAMSGAQVGIGLLLGPRQQPGRDKKEFELICKEMHDRFKERFGATCCRVLLKKGKEKKGASCRELTGGGAEIAAGLLLAKRPDLADRVNREFLERRESKAGLVVGRLLGRGAET